MNKLNNFELDKFCPGCNNYLIYDYPRDHIYYCGNDDCNLVYQYFKFEKQIYIEELIVGYGYILFINQYFDYSDYEYYKYVFHEPDMSPHEILEKYNEFKENLIFL